MGTPQTPESREMTPTRLNSRDTDVTWLFPDSKELSEKISSSIGWFSEVSSQASDKTRGETPVPTPVGTVAEQEMPRGHRLLSAFGIWISKCHRSQQPRRVS